MKGIVQAVPPRIKTGKQRLAQGKEEYGGTAVKKAKILLPLLCGVLVCGPVSVLQASDAWEEAETTPFAPYPETVTYTLGKMINASYTGMPGDDTYADNVYTRYIEEKLNIKTELVLSADSPNYSAMEEVAISGAEIPDIMVIDDVNLLETLVENDMVEDLTPYYNTCFSERILEIYDSYGDDRLSMVTFDGKIYGIPDTDIYSSANFIWLRKDWMDELGLEDPETLEDVAEIIRQFMEKDPGGNGEGQTVGLLCDKDLIADTSNCYNIVPIFANFGAYPSIWVPQEDGTIQYGSVLPETKEALKLLQEWYAEGILDQSFLLRTERNNAKLVKEGKSGSFFGWWWAPNNPLEEAMRENPDAVWQPYLLSNDGNGGVNTYLPYAAEKYVVVRKGYEHPEVVMKIMSIIYDYARYEESEAEEIQEYFSGAVDPSVTPLVINCDYSDAIQRVTTNLKAVLSGEKDRSSLNTLEKGYYDACVSYLGEGEFVSCDWAAYTSRITAVGLLMENEINYVNEDYMQGYGTLVSDELQEYETEYLLKIIIGEEPLSAFDEMVQQWYARGGSKATRQAQEIYAKSAQ